MWRSPRRDRSVRAPCSMLTKRGQMQAPARLLRRRCVRPLRAATMDERPPFCCDPVAKVSGRSPTRRVLLISKNRWPHVLCPSLEVAPSHPGRCDCVCDNPGRTEAVARVLSAISASSLRPTPRVAQRAALRMPATIHANTIEPLCVVVAVGLPNASFVRWISRDVDIPRTIAPMMLRIAAIQKMATRLSTAGGAAARAAPQSGARWVHSKSRPRWHVRFERSARWIAP